MEKENKGFFERLIARLDRIFLVAAKDDQGKDDVENPKTDLGDPDYSAREWRSGKEHRGHDLKG